jgi:hypothetical protein
MSVPDNIRDQLTQKLWASADAIDWLALGPAEKSQHYDNWTHDTEVGGVLSRFMDIRQVRVYIKDSLLKKFPQVRQADATKPFQLLSISATTQITKIFIRPHGRQLCDGRIVSWGRAADWKAVLLATHERSFRIKGARPYAVVLLKSAGKYGTDEARAVVMDAAAKLGIERLIWDM